MTGIPATDAGGSEPGRARWKLLLKCLFGGSVLVVLLVRLDLRSVGEAARATSPPLILLVVAYVFLTYLLNALNYSVLMRGLAPRVPFRRVLFVYVLGWSLGKFTVGRLGEFTVVPLLRREGLRGTDAAAVLLIDKAISLFWLLFFGALGFALFFPSAPGLWLALGFQALILLGIPGIRSVRLRGLLARILPGRVGSRLVRLAESVSWFLDHNRTGLVLDSLLTIARLLLGGFAVAWLLSLYGASAGVLASTIVNAVGTTVALLPVSISGLGVKEAAVVILFGRLGVDGAICGVVYLLIRLVGLLWAVLVLLGGGRRLLRL